MHADLALQMLGDLFWTGLLVCAPVLGLMLVVGLVISIIQVVTQVQEMSLTFVPKLLVTSLSLLAFGPWMLRTLSAFTARLWAKLPTVL